MRRRHPPGRSTRRPLPFLALLFSALAVPSVGTGQAAVRASADAGAALIHQRGDTIAVIAPTVGGELDLRRERTAGRATLTSTLAVDGRWSAQGDLLLTHFAGPYGSPWEVGSMASVLRYTGETATTQLTAYGRRHLDRLAWGAWGGASAGLTVRKYWRAPILAVEGGAWSRLGPLQLSLGVATQRAHLDSSNAYEFPPFGLPPGVTPPTGNAPPPPPSVAIQRGFDITTLVATDVTALAAWRDPRFELSATTIARHAPAQASRLLGSALASVAWWAQPSLALTASAGTLAADPIRSAPASRFVTFGARWRPSPSSPATRPRAPSPGTPETRLPAATAGRAAADVVVRASGEKPARILRVLAPEATRVEVRGDATEWRPVALTAAGRYWELVLPAGVEAGTQRLVVRVDGGEWVVPANLPTVEDDFGARVGLLVVP